jgi:hypothetical protein
MINFVTIMLKRHREESKEGKEEKSEEWGERKAKK